MSDYSNMTHLGIAPYCPICGQKMLLYQGGYDPFCKTTYKVLCGADNGCGLLIQKQADSIEAFVQTVKDLE